MTQPIPFHLTYVSTAMSLAAFLPFSPGGPGSSSTKKSITRIELVRQSTADVRLVAAPAFVPHIAYAVVI